MSDPMGDFVLPIDKTIPLLYVAGGIGITPVRSMIKWLSDTKEERRITIVYVTRSADEFAFIKLFNNYGATLIQLNTEHDGEKAHLNARRILDIASPESQTQIYLSGPEPMIEALVAQFDKQGYDQHQLITDYFPGYTPI